MEGLGRWVHEKLQKHIDQRFTREELEEDQVIDTVEVGEQSQMRTFILKNGNRYYCLQSLVDYTQYVNGVETYETKHHTFHLPEIAVRALMNNHVAALVSDSEKYRNKVSEDPASVDPAPAERNEGCDAGDS